MPTVLFLIAQTNFRDEELLEPKEVLEQAGITCTVASLTTALATGKLGAKVHPDIAIKDAKADDYDAITLVGGPGAPELANHPEVIKLINDFENQQKLISAICIAPTILAKAGVLKNKKATVFKTENSVAILQNAGAEYIEQNVVEDDRLITADGPTAAREFGEKLKSFLLSEKH